MTDLSLDFETFSAVPIAEAGSFKYMEDPSFRILMVSYAINDGEVVTLDLEKSDEGLDKFLDMIRDPRYVKHAWNCAFERYALQRAYGIYSPPEEWKDTMILSAYCGLPLALGQCSEALLLPQDKAKDKRGKELIRLFSCPNRKGERVLPSEKPEAWAEYLSYNNQDVVAERHIRKMLDRWEPPKDEHRIWCLDARINERGIRIDRTLAEQAHLMGERYKAELMDRALEITGLDNPNSVAQVKDWLKEQEGIEVQSLNKKAVADVVAQLQTDKAKEFLEIRAALSKTSIKKYDAMLDRAGEDDHAKGCFQFYGSHTGRWAGRGIQLQNLPQNHMPDLDVARELVRSGDYETVSCLYGNVSSTLSELIRTALIPEEGHKFCVSDYSAIEARVTSYLSDCQWRIKTFAEGGDIYCASASQMFKVPVVKHGENGHLRQKGKVAELALGYGGGVGALRVMGGDKMGLSDEEMGEIVAMWRQASPEVCALWSKLEKSAIRCCERHVSIGTDIKGMVWEWEKGIMFLHLPSGRRIAYFNPEYRDVVKPHRSGMALTYMTINQTTRKRERVETWGGKLLENCVQAFSADCLRESMLALEAEGWDIRAHVHDEIICTEPVDGRTWKDMAEVMGRPISWAPGLLLRGDGYDTPYYQKD